MLTDQELIHYSRHILLPQIDEIGQQKLKNASVLVVGLGGLGSPVALYLAASGVGHLYLADDDKVESSNLQRQIIHNLDSLGQSKVESAKSHVQSLNPWTNISILPQKLLGKELDTAVSNVDLVIDCSDNFATRFAINKACFTFKKILISGSAIRFEGQLAVFNFSASSACYQCLYQPEIELNENCFDQGVLSPLVGTIGTLQATEAIKIITGAGNVADSQLIMYDALNMDFRKMQIAKDPHCAVCSQ